MLSLTPQRHISTQRLIALAMSVAGIYGMHWKLHYMRPRPAQVWPGLLPLLPTPPHPSYPSNHAAQAWLTCALLSQVHDGYPTLKHYLQDMAGRIALNRERAGLHFASDTAAGKELAGKLAGRLGALPFVADLIAECRREAGVQP